MSNPHLRGGGPEQSARRSAIWSTQQGEAARRSPRRMVAAILSPVVASVGMVGIASPASADVVPVGPPHDISVFPMRDFLGVGGWGAGAEMHVRVIRDGVQIGSAGPMTLAEDAELDGFAEVNHPGGYCWKGVTPNLVAGDRIEAVDADGNGDFTVIQNVEVTTPATRVDADDDGQRDDVIARGMASNVAGTARINPALVEQRIINPDLKDTAVGRRDVRAIFGDGLADGVDTLGEIKWDDPDPLSTDPRWTATYLNVGGAIADLIVAGQSRIMAWERTDAAANRIGMTLWEYGEVGGPGMGGCPLGDNYAVGGASPRNINIASSEQANLILSGTARDVDTVTVRVDDHDPATAPVTGEATVARPTSLDPTVAMAGNTTWTATLPMAELKLLDDDTLVASASFGLVQETTTEQDTDGLPETPPVPVTTRTSSPIGGADLNILKDLTAPEAPTAFPGGGRFETAQSVTINAGNEIEDVVRYRVGASDAGTADPTAASPVVPVPLPVTTSQMVKARAYDPAGNPSPVSTFSFMIAPDTVPGAPTGVTANPGNADATVTWTAPTDDGGTALTGYVVETYRGGAFLKSNSFSTTATSVVIPGLANGTAYAFRVRAVNALGQSALSDASAAVTPVGPADTTAPTASVVPAANATGVAVGANLTATFDEPVTGVSGTTFFLRAPGSTTDIAATVSYNAATRIATLNPTVNLAAGTTYTASLTSGIQDAASPANPLASRTWTFTTAGVLNAAPTVTARTPAQDATSISVAGDITATFSETVQGVSTASFAVRPAATPNAAPIGGTVTRNGTTNQWILNPSANLARDTRYTVTLTGGAAAIRDAQGAALAATSWSFVTGPAPTVTARTPGVGATGVNRTANVTATFSENVQAVSGSTVTLRNLATNALVTAVVSYNATGRVVTLNPSATLPARTQFRVNLSGGETGIRDAAGNPLANVTWTFTTGA